MATLIIDRHIGKVDGLQGFTFADLFEFYEENGYGKHTIILNSPGGNVGEGFFMHDFIKSLAVEPNMVAVKCHSITTILHLSVSPENRHIVSDVNYMIHNPWVSIQGDADTMAAVAERLKEIEVAILDFYVDNTKGMREELREWMQVEKVLGVAELLELQFASKVVEMPEMTAPPEVLTPVAYSAGFTMSEIKTHNKEKLEILNLMKSEKEGASRLEALMQSLGEKIDKMISPKKEEEEVKALILALEDGRMLNIQSEDNLMNVGQGVSIDGKAVEDGVYNTAETDQAITIENGQISAIEAIEKAVMISAEDVEEYVSKAVDMVVSKTSEQIKNLSDSLEAQALEINALKQDQAKNLETIAAQAATIEAQALEIQNLKKNTSSTHQPMVGQGTEGQDTWRPTTVRERMKNIRELNGQN